MRFEKTATTVEEQIALLQSRGMIFPDPKKAANYLSNISYYRISAYWFTFYQDPPEAHEFKPGTTFDQCVRTYVFDRKLRILLFDEIERIEIALRTQIIYHFAHALGNNWWEEAEHFIDAEYFEKFREIMGGEVSRSSEKFISHYRKKYKDPPNPPCWMMLELASLGQLSQLYKNLKGCEAKKAVADHFLVSDTVLMSWLKVLSSIRNKCAHHSRLWNKKLTDKAILPTAPRAEWITVIPDASKHRLIYIGLCVIQYLLKSVLPSTSFPKRLKLLMASYPELPRHYMGFPEDWENDPFWTCE